MKHCPHCHVDVQNPLASCPLCQNPLQSGEGEERWDFPEIPLIVQKHAKLLRLLIFISIAGVLISGVANFFFHEAGWWFLIVLAGVGYFWIAVSSIIKHQNSLIRVTHSVIVIGIILFVIDVLYSSGANPCITYGIPALLFSAIASIVTISLIRGLPFSEFVLYIIVTGLFALIPLVFLLTGLATVAWPSIVCILAGVLALISVFVFADRNVKDELKGRFHL